MQNRNWFGILTLYPKIESKILRRLTLIDSIKSFFSSAFEEFARFSFQLRETTNPSLWDRASDGILFGLIVGIVTSTFGAILVKYVKYYPKPAKGDEGRNSRRRGNTGKNEQKSSRVPNIILTIGIVITAFVLLFTVVSIPTIIGTDPRLNEDTTEAKEPAKAGWGPDREDFTFNNPPSLPTLNSVTDNPDYGNEKNFTLVRKFDSNNRFEDYITVTPGDTYTVRTFFSNNSRGENAASAEGVKVKAQVPALIEGSARISGLISSTNMDPSTIWDGAVMNLPDITQSATLRYVQESARVVLPTQTIPIDGHKLLSDDGVLIGCDARLDGILLPTSDCSGYVEYELKVVQSNFEVIAVSRIEQSDNELSPYTDVAVGDILEIRIQYKNTGSVQQRNVMLSVQNLPPQLDYISGSALLSNSNSGNKYRKTRDGVVGEGINIGHYSPGASAYLKISAEVTSNKMAEEMPFTIIEEDFAQASTDNGVKTTPLQITVVRR